MTRSFCEPSSGRLPSASRRATARSYVQCVFFGFTFGQNAEGEGPTVGIESSTIQNAVAGIVVGAGLTVVSHSTIQFNNEGVFQAAPGSIDLSEENTVVCSNYVESGDPSLVLNLPPVSVMNDATYDLNASNVAWDALGPNTFMCNDEQLKTCGCQDSNCTVPGFTNGPYLADGGLADNGFDGISESTGKITTTGAKLSSIACNVP